MSRIPKLIVFAVGGLVGILLLLVVVVLLYFGATAQRKVETLVSDAVGMEVNVHGPLDINFFPNLHITMKNVRIRNGGSEIASATQPTV